jgi:hypothetical protein
MGKKILRHIAFLATGLAVTVVQAANLPECSTVVKSCIEINSDADYDQALKSCDVFRANADAFATCNKLWQHGFPESCSNTCLTYERSHDIKIPRVCWGTCR